MAAEPAHFNFIRAATRPVEHGVIQATSHLSTLDPPFTIVVGAGLILGAVRYLRKLLMVGRAHDILIKAVGRNAYLAMASGMGVTVVTQSSTSTTSVLAPFAKVVGLCCVQRDRRSLLRCRRLPRRRG